MKRLLFLVACIAIFFQTITAAQTELSVMSFNIRYGSANDGNNAWDLRRDVVANTIREYGPDIFGTQECLLFQAQYLDNALTEYEHFGVGRERNGGGERMEIFYKTNILAPIETGNFWLSETPSVPGSRSWKSANIRMVTWAKFYHLKSKQFFYYLNTHFDHRSEEARAGAAALLAKFIQKLPKDAAVILTGDFNSDAERSEPWRILTRKAMRDSWLDAEKRVGPEVTWSGFKPPSDSVNRIDWILYRGPLDVLRCETVTYNEDNRFPSDHYPVFAKFVLRK